jgi:hypothetical protein
MAKQELPDCDVCQNKRYLYGNSWRDENRKQDLPIKYRNVSFVRLPCPKCNRDKAVIERIKKLYGD